MKLRAKTNVRKLNIHNEFFGHKEYTTMLLTDNIEVGYLHFVKFDLNAIDIEDDLFQLHIIFDYLQDYSDFYSCLLYKNDYLIEILKSKDYIFYISSIYINPLFRGNLEILKKFKQTLIECGAKDNIVGCLPYPDKEITKVKPNAQTLLIRYLRYLGLKNFVQSYDIKAIIEFDYQ